MKKIFYLVGLMTVLVFAGSTTNAQIRKIPAEVTESFAQKFPDASNVEWRDKLSGFTASFSVDSIQYVASFNNDGEWENTEQVIEQSALPEAVQDGFEKSRYADWNLNKVIKIELPDDIWQYKIEVSKGDIKKRNLYFNSKGRLLKDKLTL